MMNLATSLSQQGKYGEAETMQRQTLQLQSLRQQGKYAEAEAMDQQTLQLQETVLGKDHLALVAYRCRPLLTGQFYHSVRTSLCTSTVHVSAKPQQATGLPHTLTNKAV
ncbi:hypothetical protein VE01_04461 [Pseudogymnoascus verrucosus]|uniref:Uncharacterized protein n=1 Tax=Pseudogymnoascus verrucosus TaxID=342668 RepID=A0A1B8GPA0_9PEZI|nr:uncharacterized protein VE01_04461 [Pseudogymnoascus verrucosus]OBT97644.1 hypothetical protein VE01_04461 [Pseudogymnoascus verrucosus]